jgi:hypothetical protein
MAYSPDATSVVLGAFISAINSDLRRRARKRKLHGRLQTGSLTVVQRFGSSLNLNVHFHIIGMNGVYAEQPDANLLFHPLPAPSDEDLARMARAVCRKVTRVVGWPWRGGHLARQALAVDSSGRKLCQRMTPALLARSPVGRASAGSSTSITGRPLETRRWLSGQQGGRRRTTSPRRR